MDAEVGKESQIERVRLWLGNLSHLATACQKRFLTTEELDRELQRLGVEMRETLEVGSPEWRTFDRELKEIPTEYRKVSLSPYVTSADCLRIEVRRRILTKVLVELVPDLDVLGDDEILNLPEESQHDLAKAKTRLKVGDFSGAMGAACGAIDAATGSIFIAKNLGDPREASFQERVNLALSHHGAIPRLEQELIALGWDQETARRVRGNLTGSMNQAAYVMQTLRSRMGDAHGTQDVLEPLVYDSLKWAALILRLLQEP